MTKSCISVFFIGCVHSSEVVLRTLVERPETEVLGVLSLRQSNFNADFVDLSRIAAEESIPMHYAENTDTKALANILRDLEVDIVFAVGWSQLLGSEILDIPRHGVVGFHPAALPQNRGRHPLIWSIALGLDKTASTFFFIDEGTDSGPILSQEEIEITPQDDAGSLYDKVLAILPGQINRIIDNLVEGELSGIIQNHELANLWRKRGAPDGLIDWRMSAQAVYNLTRALTHPYLGAEFRHGDYLIKVWRCEIVTDEVPSNAEPGKVLRVDDRGPIIKTGLGADGGAVRLLDTEGCPELYMGEYL